MYPVSVFGLRVRFYSFAILTATGVVLNAPVWSIAASAFLCAAIPLAVAFQDPERLRALFLPVRAATAVAPVRKAVHHGEGR